MHADQIELSFEIFPPKDGAEQTGPLDCIARLAPLDPRFVSVTYGAGGTTRARTLETLGALRAAHPGLSLAGHLTCVGQNRNETLDVARAYLKAGVERVVALRGDMPGGGAYRPHPEGFADTAELVAALSGLGFREIAVAAYPEKHPESADIDADIDNLKRKIDAGATCAITQFFFDNTDFYRFVERARAAGIDAPIVPGILPVTDHKGVFNFARKCGSKVPERMAERFALAEDRGAARELALAYCVGQCDELRAQGVRRLHVYTLNKADLTLDVCQGLGLAAQTPRLAPVEGVAA